MSVRKGRGYPYSLDESAPRTKTRKAGSLRSFIWVPVVLLVVGGALLFIVLKGPSGWTSLFSPFPKHLIAMRFQHNGKEVVLTPDSLCVVNPRDTLQLLEAKTDGWLSWGTRIVATDADAGPLLRAPVTMRDLYPKENFEAPKLVDVEAVAWSNSLGKVSFQIQLDARDWLQKANAISDPGQRIAFLEKALQENTGNVLVKTQLASLYYDSKRYEDAGRLYREIAETGKTEPVLEKLLAIYQAQNKVDEVLSLYLELLKLTDNAETFKEFIQYLQKHKSKDEASRFIERHQNDFPRQFQSPLLLVLADLNTQTKNWAKVASAYEKALKAGVKDPDILYNIAVAYQQGDDPDKAIQALERYLQKNPGDVKSWMQLAELQEKKGAMAQARSTYETILQKNPQNKDALLRLIAILEKGSDKAALQSAYERLAQMQPKNKTLQHNLAILYYESKKWEKAIEAFEAMAAADPKDVQSRKYLLDLYRKVKNEKGEAAMLKALSQADPGNKAYQETIFASYDEKKDYKGIVSFFKEASERQPDSVQLHNYLLYAYLKLNDSKSALKELEHLARLQPKEKKHLRQAANLYETIGDYGEALKKVDQIMKLDPKDKEAKDDYLRLRLQAMTKKKP